MRIISTRLMPRVCGSIARSRRHSVSSSAADLLGISSIKVLQLRGRQPFSRQALRRRPGGISSPHGLMLFDGVCVLCSRGCRFVSKRDRRGYFRFVPIQLTEGRPLAEHLGIDPDRPDSFAFLASGQAYVKSEAVLRIARELPRWQWTWIFQFIPRVIRDAIYAFVARNRYRWFGRREPPGDCGRWRLALVGRGRHDEGSSVAAFQLSPCHRKHNLPDQLRVRLTSDRSGIA